MNTLFLCGAGNPSGVRLALNVNKVKQKWHKIVILDDNPEKKNHYIFGCKISGSITELQNASPKHDAVANLIAGSTESRKKVTDAIKKFGLPFALLIHPQVDTLGVTLNSHNITVYENATLGANATLNEGCIVFMNAVVGHGATMEEGSILGPGAVLNARVILGRQAYFGTNASILPDLVVGSRATVAQNSAVVTDVPDNSTVIGVPARSMGDSAIANEATTGTTIVCDDFPDRIIALWQNILMLPDIKPDDNFFEIGGTSRKALELVEAIKEDTQLTISVIDIFRYPSINAMINSLSLKSTANSGADDSRYQNARTRAHSRALARSYARAWARKHQTDTKAAKI